MIVLPDALYVDGDYTVATPVGAPVFSSPLPGLNEPVVLTQQFQQFNVWYAPLALNTAYSVSGDLADFYLVSESERQDIGGGMVEWTRTYAAVPDDREEASSLIYNYPGIEQTYTTPGTSNTFQVTLRLATPLPTTAKVLYEYFLVGAGGTYATFEQIPVIQHTRFYVPIFNGLIEVGKQDVTIVNTQTVPTADEYQADQASGLFDIVAQDSQVSRWMGNIFQRVTLYIPAL